MPCYTPDPTPEEIADSSRNSNLKKYGLTMTDSELIAYLLNMCCEMGGTLEAEGIEDRLTPDTLNWYVRHKERDRLKRQEEISKKIKELEAEYSKLNHEINKIDVEILDLQGELSSL